MIFQSMKMAVKSICLNKLRSFLTMHGIIIGVVSLVVLVSLVHGATGSINESMNSLRTNLISVSIINDYNQPLKYDDLSDFFAECKVVDSYAPAGQDSLTVSSQSAEETVSFIGTTSEYGDIQKLELASGRFLKGPDNQNHTNVIVINESLATDVLGRSDVTGEILCVGGKSFKVIGVVKDNTTSEESSDYKAFVPYTTLIRLSERVSLNVTSVCLAIKDDQMDVAEAQIENLLLKRFYNDDSAFRIFNQSSLAEAMESVTGTLSLLLGGIAGISLFVGGIGIMNIMLVSVTERTKEIGIRKAVGAGMGMILSQFLIEALVVSLTGCFLGIVISGIALKLVNLIGNVSYSISGGVVTLSILFSVAIGVVFGIYPAWKAAKMKPIDALRF